MVSRSILAVAFFAASALQNLAFAQSVVVLPPTNTPLVGCVEGRAARIVGNTVGCGPTAATAVTGGTLSPNANDFFGQVTTTSGLSIVLTMTKLYNPGLGCLVQTNSIAFTALPVTGATSTNSTLTITLSLSTPGAKLTYLCSPI